ncbi:MAG TPA: GNAT family N-acetyltransferase, partial [Vicinamibacteria bacterium]|nr:GNAT family N-acetyltransferase [Vicinamibacteria bacterium]
MSLESLPATPAAVGQSLLAAPEAAAYSADALLRDGTSVHVRAIHPDDKERLRDHFHGLSPESVYNRFFGMKKDLTAADLHYFTELDFGHHVGLAVVRRAGGAEQFLGVARFIQRSPCGPGELGMAVVDAAQGLGVGTLILEHLAMVASSAGVAELTAEVLVTNHRMIEMLRSSGFVARETTDGASLLHYALSTGATTSSRHGSDERLWIASAAGVRSMLHPRSVALLGASREVGSIGRTILANLAAFRGPVYAVNPRATEIDGRPCYARLADAPGPVDLAVIAVPAAQVEASMAECVAAGVHSAVVVSAGFGEASSEGRAAQARLLRVARESGLRLVGPNCLGIMNTDPEVQLNATFAPGSPPAGNVGFLSQSGALGLAILDHAAHLHLGLSSFVSVGNKADVSGNDLLAYWKDDPRTKVVALYLESFGNPRRFARLAPEVARRKPVVAVKSGRSKAGTRAAASHSAALACSDVAVDALFTQAGVVRTDTLEELFDVISLLSTQPIPTGSRVGVVTNAGGPGILLADACESLGLALPELSGETQARLRTFLPAAAGLRNPVDMIASAPPEAFEKAIAAVGADPGVDSVIAIYVPPQVTKPEDVAAAIAR